jgi:hypothetical protein
MGVTEFHRVWGLSQTSVGLSQDCASFIFQNHLELSDKPVD